MKVFKIASKYCTEDKVQLMVSNPDSQIICSKDGYLYLRDEDITMHRYLTDPVRKSMPYANKPISEEHTTHLFKYDQIYARFADGMVYDEFGLTGRYDLVFYYFMKNKKDEAIGTILFLSDFGSEEEIFENLTQKDVEKFLYQTDGARGKYIFNNYSGIKYVWDSMEQFSIDKKVIDFSDENIIDIYNRCQFSSLYYEAENYKKATTIGDVEECVISERNGFMGNSKRSKLLVIKEKEILLYNFEVIYCSKDCYKIKSTTHRINIGESLKNKIKSNTSASYTDDPEFDE